MSKVFFPNANQFDEMNRHLADIVSAIASGSQIDTSTWAGIQRAVRLGLAPNLFPIGTQFVVGAIGGVDENAEPIVFDVVAHDHYKSPYDESSHTMTLLSHDSLCNIQFDRGEAFYYAAETLPAGTYYFALESPYLSWEVGVYNFTLTENLPQGGVLALNINANTSLTSGSALVRSYRSRYIDDYAFIEDCAITTGKFGTYLGAMGKELNNADRVAWGSNNYFESSIRQFINPDITGWVPSTKYDMAPNWTAEGYQNNIQYDADFLAVVGKVLIPCSTNRIYEQPDFTLASVGEKYVLVDKFFLPSSTEIYGTAHHALADDSVLFPYFDRAVAADHIKYDSGAATKWWTRSATSWDATHVIVAMEDGNPNNWYATSATGCAVACNIV